MSTDAATGVDAGEPGNAGAADEGAARQHHAFIAYHQDSSGRAAHALQRELERVASRNEIDPPLDAFRDETDLTMGGLYENLRRELARSRRLVVVLHRRTLESPWVNREVQDWLAAGGTPDRLILVNIDPDLQLRWDDGDLNDEYPLPPALRGLFPSEPVIVNVPWWRLRGLVDRGNQVARLCATLLELDDPSDLLQHELEDQRRRQRRLGAALTAMSILAVLAIAATVVATQSRDQARRRESEAVAQASAAEALLVASERPERSVDLLIEAATESPSRAVRSAIFAVLAENPRLTGILEEPDSFDGQGPDDVVFSPSGQRLAGWQALPNGEGTAYALWDVDTKSVITDGIADVTVDLYLEFLGEDRLVFCGAEGVETLDLTSSQAPLHQIAVEGTGTCLVTPVQGGALGVAGKEGTVPGAALLDADGDTTIVDGVRLAATNRYDDVAFIHSKDGLRAWSTDGEHVPLDPPGALRGNLDILSVHDRGHLIVQAEDGRVLAANAYAAEPWARPVPGVPAGALAVAPLGETDHIWLTADDHLQWSQGPESIPVGDLRGDGVNASDAQPAIWVSQEAPIAVVAYGRGATVVRLGGSTPIARVHDVTISAAAAGRTSLMSPLERGASGVILPRDTTSSVLIADEDMVHPVEGFAFFDPTGAVAVSFGDAPMQLFPDRGAEPEEISSASDVAAVALSANGSRMAVVRPTSPVSVYATRTVDGVASLSLVETGTEPWQGTAAFGTRRFRANNRGQFLVAEHEGTRTASFDQFVGSLKGIHAVRPDGLAAVVAEGQEFSEDPTDNLYLIDAEAGTDLLPEICQPAGAVLRFLPGRDFRDDLEAAELQQLTVVASSDDTEGSGGGPFACPVDGQPPPVADPGDILEYQLDDDGGRIVARRGDGQVDVTTWRRGEPGSLAPSIVPGTGRSSYVGLNTAGDLAARTNLGSGAISVLERDGSTWRPTLEVRSTVPDVVAAIPDDREQLLTVVGAGGAVEVFGLDGGHRLVHASAPLSLPSGGDDAGVRWASVETTDDAYVVHLAVGRVLGPVQAGTRVSIPLDVDALRAHLCSIHPAAASCD